MANNVRTVDFLPEIFQTPVNRQFLATTLDQLVQEPKFKKNQGFIGRRIGPGVNANDRYVVESTTVRNNWNRVYAKSILKILERSLMLSPILASTMLYLCKEL